MSECNEVYAERNRLVSFLSRCYLSYLAPASDAEPGFEWIVYIETPEGQLSWHLHDDELPMFNHCPRQKAGSWWDGHTSEDKYARLLRLRPPSQAAAPIGETERPQEP
jgi:hypothetical protein